MSEFSAIVIPLFEKEGQGEIFRKTAADAPGQIPLSPPFFKGGSDTCNPIDACFRQERIQEYFPSNLFTPLKRRVGIPIGNLTSQLFANLYLDDVDTLTF